MKLNPNTTLLNPNEVMEMQVMSSHLLFVGLWGHYATAYSKLTLHSPSSVLYRDDHCNP